MYELPVETVITAVSQKPDLAAMNSEELGDGWLNGDDWGFTGVDGVWTGGDNINLGIATTSIGQARKAADAIHAHLQGTDLPKETNGEMIRADKLKIDWYEPIDRTQRQVKSPDDRLANPFDEVDLGLTDPWSEAIVSETIVADDGQTQLIRATVVADGPAGFLRLKVAR